MSSIIGRPFSREGGLGPRLLQLLRVLEQLLVLVQIKRRNARRAGERMARIGVAVEQLDHMVGALHERVVDALAAHDAAHRHGAGGDALGEGDHVRDARRSARRRSACAEAAEAGDDLVEDQQDAVLVADLAQPLAGSPWAAAARRSSPPSARR